ncbi:putative O-methyltransferase YrrM [Scopulibacillus daqui]|uniref:tRNA 5-hydroxyuridine methyltransferase n=1 Tax=Scopulibacillus daqui TaxID=1469162 RepID=A0ABS2Q0M4_9BACL|nr:O-methyltransferase [Scopulibacillus daqui]MBM7645853.1 putative O-methyltransferase YrrM [Scopulibacillus daqui]
MEDQSLSRYTAALAPKNIPMLDKLEKDARDRKIPIMQPDGMALVQHYIKLIKPKRILEIGTAIGYSAIKMALASESAQIFTIERQEEMYKEALKNIQSFGLDRRIQVIKGDAAETAEEIRQYAPFDFIFIDAAKGQYRLFFELYSPLLSQNGLIITDNVLFRGLAAHPERAESKRLRKLAEKINRYNEWLSSHPDFDSVFLTVGDGIAVSAKK